LFNTAQRFLVQRRHMLRGVSLGVLIPDPQHLAVPVILQETGQIPQGLAARFDRIPVAVRLLETPTSHLISPRASKNRYRG
jgi:hypothetical protein